MQCSHSRKVCSQPTPAHTEWFARLTDWESVGWHQQGACLALLIGSLILLIASYWIGELFFFLLRYPLPSRRHLACFLPEVPLSQRPFVFPPPLSCRRSGGCKN